MARKVCRPPSQSEPMYVALLPGPERAELVRAAWGHHITLWLSIREKLSTLKTDERKRQVVLDCLDG